ncbi:MAG: hypothetical protein R3B68_01655 [Phycisphaerales bacterium]
MGRSGFTLVDAAVTGLAAAVAASVVVVGAGVARDDARTARCIENMRQIGLGNAQFALANQDLMAGLSWEPGQANSKFPDLQAQQMGSSSTGAQAHAAQAVDILRRRGRQDMPRIDQWLADPGYWSLALVDFQDRDLGDTFNICPNDRHLAMWRGATDVFDDGGFLPLQIGPTPANKRWPYTSSYQATASAFDRNQSISTTLAIASRLTQGGTTDGWSIPGNARLGPSSLATVALPSRKVHVFDEFQRHGPGVDRFFGYPSARLPMLFFDGSVGIRLAGDAQPAWWPSFPQTTAAYTGSFQPHAWQPPPLNPFGQPPAWFEVVPLTLRWTRDGLLGWDY